MPASHADVPSAGCASEPGGDYRVAVAAARLRRGGVIAHPTEGVWGLACSASVEGAVWRILASKRRSWRKGLILVADCAARFERLLAQLPQENRALVLSSWPGPTTWLVPHRGEFPRWITGDSARVALRVTAHPQFAELCRRVGEPLVSTSANRAGAAPVTSASFARQAFGGEIDIVLRGELGGTGGPSAILDGLTAEQVRKQPGTARGR